MAKIDHYQLPRLIRAIDGVLAKVGPTPSPYGPGGYEAYRAHLQKYRDIIDVLVQLEHATYSPSTSGSARLHIAGLTASCTSGDPGLLMNWLSAARRKLAEGS